MEVEVTQHNNEDYPLNRIGVIEYFRNTAITDDRANEL